MDPTVRYLADRLEIRDLVTRYFVSADRRDFVTLVGCFVPGTLVDYSDLLPVDPASPIDDVAAMIDRAMAATYGPTQHFMGNHECAVDGDVATAETYCLAIHQNLDAAADGGMRPTSALRYIDRLVRTADGWRIEHRRAVRDIALTLPPRTPVLWQDASTPG
jgi:hypothetical protein